MDILAPVCELSTSDHNISAEELLIAEIKREDDEYESSAENIEYIKWEQPCIEEFIVPHEETQLDNSPTNEMFSTKKRKKNASLWKTNFRRQQKESDEIFITIKNPVWARKEPCSNCLFDCTNTFSPEERTQIFQSFWGLSEDEKSSFFNTFVSRDDIRRRTKACDSSIKQFSYKYYLEKNQSLTRVCRAFFLNTLNTDQKRIHYSFTHLKNQTMSSKEKRNLDDETLESKENISNASSSGNNILSSKSIKQNLSCPFNLQMPKIETEQAYNPTEDELLPVRDLKEPCSNCCFKCAHIFSVEERTKIFQLFWSLNDDQKNAFYKTFVTREYVKRRRENSRSCIKQYSYKYYLGKNQSLHRVCRVFFLNTLSIDQKRIYYCFKQLRNKNTSSILHPANASRIKRVTSLVVKSEIPEELLGAEMGSQYRKTKVFTANESLLTRKRKFNTSLWKLNLRKVKKETEEINDATNNEMVLGRSLKKPCNSCPYGCKNSFSTEDRINIFKSFWSLSGDEKIRFYNKFVIRDNVKRRKKNSRSDIKQFSYKYFLEKNQTLNRVCRVFFLNTLCIDQKRIYYSFKHSKDICTGFPLQRSKGKPVERFTTPEKTAKMEEHLLSISALHPRYCNATFTPASETLPAKERKKNPLLCKTTLRKQKEQPAQPIIYTKSMVVVENLQTPKTQAEQIIESTESAVAASTDIKPTLSKQKHMFLQGNVWATSEVVANRSIEKSIPKQKNVPEQTVGSTKKKIIAGRSIKEPCKNCLFDCSNIFSTAERIHIFQSFWSLSSDEKTRFYNKFVIRDNVKRRKKDSQSDIKQFSYRYFLEKNHSLHRVCRVFFLHTLSIDQKRIYYSFNQLRPKDVDPLS